MHYALGPMSGTSIAEAADIIASECEIRAIPQLPERGLGSDSIGRTAGLLAGLAVEAGPRAWQLVARPQLLTRRVWDRIEADLDELEEAWGTGLGSLATVKVQVVGPWSLGAAIELSNGHRAYTDAGALRDLTDSLIEGTRTHVADVQRRFGAEVLVQVDEPLLIYVHLGQLAGTSDFDTLAPVPGPKLAERLSTLREGIGAGTGSSGTLLNVTTGIQWDVAKQAGFDTVLVDLDQIRSSRDKDEFAELAETVRLGLGIVRPDMVVDELKERPRALAVRVAKLWDELGLSRELLTSVDVIPVGSPETLVKTGAQLNFARVVDEMLYKDAGDL